MFTSRGVILACGDIYIPNIPALARTETSRSFRTMTPCHLSPKRQNDLEPLLA